LQDVDFKPIPSIMRSNKGILFALLAALLFGASTPFAKLLVGEIHPLILAGLFYLGSGAGLSGWLLLRHWLRPGIPVAGLTASDLPWLAGATLFGGILAPILLMTGLMWMPGSSAALLLNLEVVLTALLAWFVFREHFDRRILAGMGLIVAAGLMLSWDSTQGVHASPWGALCIAGACLGWALDNNLTRKIAAGDAVQIAAAKGIAAAAVNLGAAWWMRLPLPDAGPASAAAVVGFCGYGLGLVLFVVALRHLGTGRTSAYFSAAPFAGAALALVLLSEQPGTLFWLAALLMSAGIWLHLTERHTHLHRHVPMQHGHSHVHDEHHQHAHDFDWDGTEPHVHPHRHEALEHEHPHFPDIHHRHHH
jgi:drug/metabolite transporter (DMT)-like permease